jgi:hypothetical protein
MQNDSMIRSFPDTLVTMLYKKDMTMISLACDENEHDFVFKQRFAMSN